MSRVVVAELNDGQLRREIERVICPPSSEGAHPTQIRGVHRIDGELITPQEILGQGELQ
jgi:hypothetical protein